MSAKTLADDLIDRLRATQLTICNEAADAMSAMDQQRRAFLGEIKRLQGLIETVKRAIELQQSHVHTEDCWEPDSGCDMGRNPAYALARIRSEVL